MAAAGRGPLDGSGREFRFEPRHFQQIARLLHARTGIALADSKADMVYGRLAKRLRELGLTDFQAYLGRLSGPDGEAEAVRLVNLLTTNLTRFFREPEHFRHLADVLLPAVAARHRATGQSRLRLWSAGCSSGEEAYSMAMTVRDSLPDLARWDAAILATDIDTDVLAAAGRGEYPAEALPTDARARHTVPAETPGRVAMADALRRLVVFKPLNLKEPWPFRGPFDAIFCRNVMIYFDKAGRAELVDRFADMLVPDGILYIGHSESLHGLTSRFVAAGPTLYRRVA